MDYHCLVHDKLVFSVYVAGLGFPTPKTFAVGDKDSLTWVDTGRRLGLDSLLERDIDVFCKELLGEGGRGVFPLTVTNGKLYFGGQERSLDDLRERISGHYIIQERIRQHARMSTLYPHSVNTIRLVTAMRDGHPVPLLALLRIGNHGSACDNWSAGGIMVGIDMEMGVCRGHGFFKPGCGTRVTAHPETDVVFDGFEIPFCQESIDLALRLHRLFYGIHSIGWDIAITENGPCVIEANDQWLLSMCQAASGGLRSRYLDVYPKALLGR